MLLTRFPFQSRLDQYAAQVRDAYNLFGMSSKNRIAVPFAAEWLLDNVYIVQRAIAQIRRDMPKTYYRQLATLGGAANGEPRVLGMARQIVEGAECLLDLDRITVHVQEYQEETPLTMGELWALPTMLRLTVVEKLCEAVGRLAATEPQNEAESIREPVVEMGPQEAVVANAILSLRMLENQDWKVFFEGASQVEEVLRADPVDSYSGMDFDTRDRYRKAVERLAVATELEETEVARAAVRLAEEARQSTSASPRAHHIGFFLVDGGRAELEERLGYRSPGAWLLRGLRCCWIGLYLGAIGLLTLSLGGLLIAFAAYGDAGCFSLIATGILALVPAAVMAGDLVNALVTHFVAPRQLPKMDLSEGIPADCRAMVVVPSMLTDPAEIEELLRRLEQHHMGNADPHLSFALLTDFPDAPLEKMAGDEDLLTQAEAGIRDLNRRYGSPSSRPFYLFHRRRQWNEAEGCWMGWERKRGKLAELDRLLRGKETTFELQVGDLEVVPKVRYVITLDADTAPPRDSACALIGTLAHPLNRAEFDPESGVVIAGYTVLQPRIQVKPTTERQSLFSRIFSRDMGLDLYTLAVSDVYQDLFGEGIYVGKGIYDVDAFDRSLANRVRDNTILSHDLFEGVHGRTALVTDVVFFEEFPPNYLAFVRRMHRWIRGDWQLLPWLWRRVPHTVRAKVKNRLSILDQWKILDNLLRSLFFPALLALALAGWLVLPGSALIWTLAAVSPLAAPVIIGAASGFSRRLNDLWLRNSATLEATRAERVDTLRSVLAVVFLPYEALVSLHAIALTLVRLTITHRHLLQWATAAQTARVTDGEMQGLLVWKKMISAPLYALGAAVAVGFVNPRALPAAGPLLLVWLLSPVIAGWIGRSGIRRPAALSAPDRGRLRCLARRTWLFFEKFVGPEDHWLPPDHFQEDPRGLVAHRTSPTNIGLLLLSTLAAHDLGYVGPLELALRLGGTMEGMAGLERHRNHFLNWYDTRSLEPLSPRYVSVVDSGNLAASLVVLKQGCDEMPRTRVLRWERWQGVLDILDILKDILEDVGLGQDAVVFQEHLARCRWRIERSRQAPEGWVSLLHELPEQELPQLEQALVSIVEDSPEILNAQTLHALHLWLERLRHHLVSLRRELELLHPWIRVLSEAPVWLGLPEAGHQVGDAWQALVDALGPTPRLFEVVPACEMATELLCEIRTRIEDEQQADRCSDPHRPQALEWCGALERALDSARAAVENLLRDYRQLSSTAEAMFDDMKFDFLFDSRRQVFHIGYNVEAGKLDDNHYDLLASEARLTSLLAIAKGDAPLSHWLHLARPLTRLGRSWALLSWSGTMFEYLMPLLWTGNTEETLLGESCSAAVQHQMSYARDNGIPWGISESSYYAFDASMNYQYRAFGVPRLGFKRGLRDDLVVSPYASLLALSVSPREVMRNLDRLLELEMLGLYGFFEAIDFTPSRLGGRHHEIVRSYMAHHQAMILLALCNALSSNTMIHRFHADRWVQSTELLLNEQMPLETQIEYPRPPKTGDGAPLEMPRARLEAWCPEADLPSTQAHVLSNGRYAVLITASGAGYSRWREWNLTRWRADSTLEDLGTWIYVRDLESHNLWSVCRQPFCSQPQGQEVLFFPHKVEFQRREHDISMRTEIVVAPDDDVEIRRITLANHSDRRRVLSLTSFAEVALASPVADRRHPTFSKLFVDSEHVAEVGGLLFRRRPRSHQDEPIHIIHMVTGEGPQEMPTGHECDRGLFLGRGGNPRSPAALSGSRGLTGTTGPVLDPIMSLEVEIELKPHDTFEVAFVTLAAGTRQQALNVALEYHAWPRIERAFGEARSRGLQELVRLELTSEEIGSMQRLLSALLFVQPALRAPAATLAANRKGQPALWPYGISGDDPILLVSIAGEGEAELVREALRAHVYWRQHSIKVDLVILSFEETSYDPKLTSKIRRYIQQSGGDVWLNRHGGIFVLIADHMSEDDLVLLKTVAGVNLDGARGSLSDQLERLQDQPVRLPRLVPTRALPVPIQWEAGPPARPQRPTDLLFDNAVGGFRPDGTEYVIYLEPGQWTPAPWINVIANPHFGFLVSEAGSGFSWAENSGENRLTTWHNDPVMDPPGEALYIRDEETGDVWSPTPLPVRAGDEPYLIRHGAGYSIFEHFSHGLSQWLRLFAAPDAPVKVMQLRVRNTLGHTRRMTVTCYAEWVLGVCRELSAHYLIPEFDSSHFALLTRNPFNEEFGERVAFLAATREVHGLTSDRTEFLGRLGSYAHPAALDRTGMTARVEPGPDPCAAIQCLLWLAPGEEKEITFLLGQGANRAETLELIREFQDIDRVERAFSDVKALWDEILGTVTVRTPDPAMDLLLNRWLLYQTLSCRLWGRSALYQSSGAFGFRDQLQDVMALDHVRPDLIREHIIDAAGRQFCEGDVLHWWHPPSGRGVRTRCSDDLLWLPFVTAQYVTSTGDLSILDEKAPFLEGEALGEDEVECYGLYAGGGEEDTIAEHCRRALERGTTTGPHDLPLIGSHDWNDGMNRIGIEGRGESVWLGWFLYATLDRFARVWERVGKPQRAAELRSQAVKLRDALSTAAWDGAWFLRAFFDDGTPLGSAESDECQIDSIAQSWAVLSGAADPIRARQAMDAVADRLLRPEDGLLLLFDPPFDRSTQDPGYIKGYLPGIRENGGQYTHAAMWAAWAFAKLGDGDRAEELFRLLNPIYHAETPDGVGRYRVEPYVVAADVYSQPPHIGRGGWTWYTGSASWMYRVGLEAILGLRREGSDLRIDPCIPSSWEGYEITYQFGETTYHIQVENTEHVCRGVRHLSLDDQQAYANILPLVDDGGRHEVRVSLGSGSRGSEDSS